MEKENKDFLGREPVGKLLRKMAIPCVIGQIVTLIYNMVDRIYIGRYEPTGLALTGIGICLPVMTLITAFSSLVGMGGAPRASICMGQKENEHAEKIMGNCFCLLLIISVVLTILLSIFGRDIVMMFGGSENTIGYAMEYLGIYVLGTIFVQITLGMNAFITAQGYTRESMKTTLLGAGINIVLDPLFIFVLDMGVRGAALATVLSQCCSAVRVLIFLHKGKMPLALKRNCMGLNFKVLGPCLALGLSPFIMQSTESLLNINFNTSLQAYGGDIAVGTMTILATAMQLCFLPISGLAQGAQPITSYNYGAGNTERVRQSFLCLLKVSFAYTLLLWIVMMSIPQIFVRLFNNSNPELIEYASSSLRIYMGASLLLGCQTACQQTLIAIGYAKISICLALLRKIVLLIPLIHILPLFVSSMADKARMVFMAEPVSDALAVTTTVIVFTINFRKALKLHSEALR